MASVPGRDEILNRLRSVVAERVGVDPTLLRPEAQLLDIGIDSFMLIELVFVAEDEFEVSIPLDHLTVRSVSDVLDIIERRIVEGAT